eukprot:CAMPEP_0172592822 /NCGR_PEP_ID=MMETSP1068-20121228/11907_1 /TAXON_ID=35684 /ORGANISM="Pseudopedinella elastica, Strain CCMP716" /LENGTH=235 /DNA_ID=CAMNT_0013390035 /DNA_START=247 /DNA_END=954 /DNA_ORIENTATION=+
MDVLGGNSSRLGDASKLLNQKILPERQSSYWNTYYSKVTDFIDKTFPGRAAKLGGSLKIVEVGTAFGGNADNILGRLVGVDLFVVDPLLAGYDDKDGQSQLLGRWAAAGGMTKEGLSDAWALALGAEGRHKHGCRYHMFHMGSVEAAPFFDDSSVDVAFIDGLHTYEGVLADLRAWWPKMNPAGSLFLFNDYNHPEFPGVKKAIDEFLGSKGFSATVNPNDLPPGKENAFAFIKA